MTEPEKDSLDALQVDLQVLESRGITSRSISVDLPPEWLAKALVDTDARVQEGGTVRLDLMIQPDGTVLARGPLAASFQVPCGRCLAPAGVDASSELCITYVPHGHARAERVAAFDAAPGDLDVEEEDLDLYVYRGHVIDLAPMLRENVAVAYPMRALCPRGAACRGLCTGCGADLNELPADAEACAGCGLPLHEVSQAEADRAKAPAGGPETPWQAALRKLRDS